MFIEFFRQGIGENLINNVIGKGFTYSVEPKVAEGVEPDPDQEKVVEMTQKVVDRFPQTQSLERRG